MSQLATIDIELTFTFALILSFLRRYSLPANRYWEEEATTSVSGRDLHLPASFLPRNQWVRVEGIKSALPLLLVRLSNNSISRPGPSFEAGDVADQSL
jgi:hypothetical protein